MQYYLDGVQNNFFTFFSLNNEKGAKLKSSNLSNNYKFLKNLPVGKILNIQRMSTKNVFIKKKIPFRCFEILKKNEETLGELFIFFMFETILLGKILNLNPYDQPSVELIKKETKNFFKLI
jgi:glucose-6-phosphate isomerase